MAARSVPLHAGVILPLPPLRDPRRSPSSAPQPQSTVAESSATAPSQSSARSSHIRPLARRVRNSSRRPIADEPLRSSSLDRLSPRSGANRDLFPGRRPAHVPPTSHASPLRPARNLQPQPLTASLRPLALPAPSAPHSAQPATRTSSPCRRAPRSKHNLLPWSLRSSVAPPRAFPLKSGSAPALAAAAAPPSLVQAALLNLPPVACRHVATAQPQTPSRPPSPPPSLPRNCKPCPQADAAGRSSCSTRPPPAPRLTRHKPPTAAPAIRRGHIDGANIGLAFGVSAGFGSRAPHDAAGPQTLDELNREARPGPEGAGSASAKPPSAR